MSWAKKLSQSWFSVKELQKKKILSDPNAKNWEKIEQKFHVRVPVQFQQDVENQQAEIVKQFIPSLEELDIKVEELVDPIGDDVFSPVPHVTHRYRDRVLLHVTHQCAVFCRYCFRRNKVSHADDIFHGDALTKAVEYIAKNSEIKEVILTGGDPLVLTHQKLKSVLDKIESIHHVDWIRIHTRVPVVLPERIDEELVLSLKNYSKPVWVVVHVNSLSEFKAENIRAIQSLVENGIPCLSQSVLLKGVNDSSEKLIQLFQALVKIKVKPYYLHYPDLAEGTHHFRIPLGEAITLYESLRGKISGFALPQLIVDIPGGKGKIVAEPQWWKKISEHHFLMKSPLSGEWVDVKYPEIK